MAAILSAITPDARPSSLGMNTQRSVTFGPAFGDVKTPANGAASAGAEAATKRNEQLRKYYAQYRSSPDQYPSYERLRFVKLPESWLPEALRGSNSGEQSDNGGDAGGAGGGGGEDGCCDDHGNKLQHWPALVYTSLAELVRDLSPNESKKLKAKLVLQHRKEPGVGVARLLGWKDASSTNGSGSRVGNSGGSSKDRGIAKGGEIKNPFREDKLELIRLSPSTTLETNEGELISFVDNQFELEEVCDLLICQNDANVVAYGVGRQSADTSGEEGRDVDVARHAYRFRNAMEIALNFMAMDLGSDPLPPRSEEELVFNTPKASAASGAAAESSGRPDVEALGEADVEAPSEENVADSPDSQAAVAASAAKSAGQKKTVFSLETAKGNSKREETKSSKDKSAKGSGSRPKKTYASKSKSKSTKRAANEKENQSNAKPTSRTSLGGGRASLGGTRSRPDSGQVVPQKFQSAKKETSSSHMHPTVDEIPWKEVWAHMRTNGWTWRGPSGLSTDYRYIKPGCKIKNGIPGVDYFDSERDVQLYARTVYKWGSVSREVLLATIEEYAKCAGEVVPLLAEGLTIERNEPWRDAWDKLLKSGWTWKSGSGLMMDYYYIKPGCRTGKGSVAGQDYFVRVEDAQKFVRRNYGWMGDEAEGKEVGGDEDVTGRGREKRRSAGRASSSDDQEVKEKRQKVEKAKPAKKEVAKAATESKEPEEEPMDDSTGADDEEEEESMDDSDDEELMDDSSDADDEESVGESADADEEGIMDDEQSTFSHEGFNSKKLFLEECADQNVPPLKHELDPTEPWQNAWATMRHSGWSWKTGTGLMTDYYYIKPGCKVKGGVKGQDYFEAQEDVQAFAMRNYGWRGDGRLTSNSDTGGGRKRSGSIDKKQEGNKRQKVDKTKQMQGIHKSSKVKSTKPTAAPQPLSSQYDKKTLWQALQKEGWKAIGAGKYNNLHDWYYISPNCDPGDSSTKLGEDYFLSEEEAIESMKKSGRLDVILEKSKEGKQQPKAASMPSKAENKNEEEEETTTTAAAAKPSKAKRSQAADGMQTPAGCRTKPQDPAIPLLSSPESDSSEIDIYEWNNLWPTLQRSGWTSVKAGKFNRLHDWYYVRPNRDPGDESTVLGKHYFTCQNDVIEFVRRLDTQGVTSGKKSRKSMGIMLGAFEVEAKEGL